MGCWITLLILHRNISQKSYFFLCKYIQNKYGGTITEILDNFKKNVSASAMHLVKIYRTFWTRNKKSQDDEIHPSGSVAYAIFHLSQQSGISEKINEATIPNAYQQGLI